MFFMAQWEFCPGMVFPALLSELPQAPLLVSLCFLLNSPLIFLPVSSQPGCLDSSSPFSSELIRTTSSSELSPQALCLSHETVRASEKRWAGAKDSAASKPGTWACPGNSKPLAFL